MATFGQSLDINDHNQVLIISYHIAVHYDTENYTPSV